jgi:hypothetical protein
LIFIAGKPPGPEVKRREFVALSARASTGRKEPYMTGAVSYAAKATDERVTCLRIFADASGETHMQDINIALQPRKLFKDNPPLRLTDTLTASGLQYLSHPFGHVRGELA